jgi:hypothetical protein
MSNNGKTLGGESDLGAIMHNPQQLKLYKQYNTIELLGLRRSGYSQPKGVDPLNEIFHVPVKI